jgi:hypothetical protein
MATRTTAGIKIKVKAPKVRNPLFADEKYTGTEPDWDASAADWADDIFDHQLRQSFYYYNYYYNQKDCRKDVAAWMTTSGNFTKEDVKAFLRTPDRAIPMTVCSLVMAHKAGMPFRGKHIDFMCECIQKAIDALEPEVLAVVTGKVEAAKPTIQDRLNEKTAEVIGELEGLFDEVCLKNKVSTKIYEFLTKNNVPQSQLGKYEALFTKRKAELVEAQAKTDKQLTEGYSHLKPADFKRILGFIEEILEAVEQYRGVKKATKAARKPKVVSKEKQVAKVKYMKEDKALKIVSIPPSLVVGAKELWVFNTKTRKLGCYLADSLTGPLGIKGTSITGYDEAKSVAKTLRKPADQLKEFGKAGKVALRTFIKDIRATEVLLNGRLSADILLLKVQ